MFISKHYKQLSFDESSFQEEGIVSSERAKAIQNVATARRSIVINTVPFERKKIESKESSEGNPKRLCTYSFF